VFGAVRRFLLNVASSVGSLLVLDDLHWAGSDALELLDSLVRSTDPAQLRVLGAYRDTEVGAQSPLHSLLADLAHAGLVDQVALGGLTDEESVVLLGQLLDGETGLVERIVQRAGGVPFFLVSCAQSVQSQTLRAELPEGVPWDLAQSLRQRIAALPDDARTMLGVAAVAGRMVGLPLLLRTTELGEGVLVEALEAACRARLLEEVGADYRFVHDVVREVVEADLGAARSAMVHRRVAEALEADPATPAELLANHYARSTVQEKAIQYLELAGDRAAAQYAHGAAESYYRELLERLEGLGRTEEVSRVREKVGGVLYGAGRYAAAIEMLEEAEALLAPLLDRLGPEDSDVTRLLPVLAWAHLEQGKGDQAADEATQALVRCRREEMRPVLVEALRVQALVALRQGHPEEAARSLEEGMALARSMPYPYAEARLLTVEGERYVAQGETGLARERLEEALAIFRWLGARKDVERTLQALVAYDRA
jgi:tetratricopeptide (TPR) repeat protein